MNPNEKPDRSEEKSGLLQRLRKLPGSRAAVAAFVLAVTLGLGGPAAYAWWSQQGTASFSVTAGAPTPPPAPTPTQPTQPGQPGPPVVGPNPVLAGWPGKPTGKAVCAPLKDFDALREDQEMGISFSWGAPVKGATPTGYVVRVTSNNSGFAYDQVQNVTATKAEFQLPRSLSDEVSGNAVDSSTPYYTTYTVRVMPMNGAIAGDPLYWTYEYEHWKLDNCYNERGQGGGLGTVGNTVLTCSLPPLKWVDGYSTLALGWSPAPAATSYRVTVMSNGRSGVYGLDMVAPDVQGALRFAKESGSYGQYTARVQPMNASGAGDPVYVTYQLGEYSHECWKTGSESL